MYYQLYFVNLIKRSKKISCLKHVAFPLFGFVVVVVVQMGVFQHLSMKINLWTNVLIRVTI